MFLPCHLSHFLIALFGALPRSRREFFTPWLELPPGIWRLYLGVVLLQIVYLSFDLIKSNHKTQTSQLKKSNFFKEPELPSRKQKRWILILVKFLNLNFLLLLFLPLVWLLFD